MTIAIKEHHAQFLADAHRQAKHQANRFGLPQTVFHHADFGYANTNSLARQLSRQGMELFVTWLPDNFFC